MRSRSARSCKRTCAKRLGRQARGVLFLSTESAMEARYTKERMRKNISPWLHQLDKERKPVVLGKDLKTDVAIIGAGIAGIATAFFTLKHTDKRVVILERFKLAHGATGHNAGQIVSYFERGFAGLVEEFGLKMAAEGEGAVESAWELLDEMYTEASLD